MKGFRALLFDFDGVLSSTHADNYAAWVHAFSAHGLEVNEEEYALLEGIRSCQMVPHFLRKNGIDEQKAPEIIALKNEYYAKHNTFALYPGIEELLGLLKQSGIKLGMVSGGSAHRLRGPACSHVLETFDVSITGDDCTETKPSPQPYLRAADALRMEPVDCLVVENAPLGIRSAKTAGMKCVAVCSTLERKHLCDADVIFDDIQELLHHLSPSGNGSSEVFLLEERGSGGSNP